MIIRAESDDDTDDHDEKYMNDDQYSLHQKKSFYSKITIVKAAWLGIIFMMCFLALKDIEVIVAQLMNPSSDISYRDYVGFISQVIEIFQPSSASTLPPGLYWNHVAGILFVCVWIFIREKQNFRPARYQTMEMAGLPYSAIFGILCIGHFVSCLYIAMALYESQGNLSRFLSGWRRKAASEFAYDAT
ncbi:unnamed protein product [Albugo candida]|uniref:Uncharacterized protein n=1 Tax=Albugo candida TaxID=65357 RepID=A0A024GMM2_9STRA|nr:unnamed protein product [Albugo candida]|eukprot:CCI48137.1 unnamed protein product [Albugo candida]